MKFKPISALAAILKKYKFCKEPSSDHSSHAWFQWAKTFRDEAANDNGDQVMTCLLGR